MLGAGAAAFLAAIARGRDPGIFSEEPKSRSLSSETTFETDRKDRAGIERVLLELCHQVMFRAIDEGWKSRTPALKLRFHDFTTVSAQKTLKHWVTSAEELLAVIREMLAARWNGSTPIRLVGVGLANLVAMEAEDQLELFTDEFSRKKKVEEAVFRVRQKMGEDGGHEGQPPGNARERAGGSARAPGERAGTTARVPAGVRELRLTSPGEHLACLLEVLAVARGRRGRSSPARRSPTGRVPLPRRGQSRPPA